MTTTYVKLATETQAHDDEIWDCKWFYNENRLLTASLDDKVHIWNFDEDNNQLKKVGELEGHSLGVNSIDVSPDNKVVATRSLDSFVRFFNTTDNIATQNIDCAPAHSWTIEFFPNGGYVATGSMTGHIYILRVSDGEKVLTIDAQLDFVIALNISPNGKLLAASGMDGKVRVFELDIDEETAAPTSSKTKFSFDAHFMPVRALCFTADQNLVTGSDDNQIKVHSLDGKTTTVLDTMCGHGGWILSIRRSPDNRHLVSTSADNKLKIWDLLTRECVHTFSDHQGKCWAAAFNSKGNKLASVSSDKSLVIYDCPVA